MKRLIFKLPYAIVIIMVLFSSCEAFLEVPVTDDELSPDIIFSNPTATKAAMAGVYVSIRDTGIVSGGSNAISNLLGLYTDELIESGSNDTKSGFTNNNIRSDNSTIKRLWSTSFNVIFQVNNIIAGVQNSNGLNEDDKNQFIGEALFIRAFMYSMMVELWGDVPYLTETDRLPNAQTQKTPKAEVYTKITADLEEAKSRLGIFTPIYTQGSRYFVDKVVADALLARVYLYNENWQMAANHATSVIEIGDNIVKWETNLDEVFLAPFSPQDNPFDGGDFTDHIWSLIPNVFDKLNTSLGSTFIINATSDADISSRSVLFPTLLNAFEPNDLRRDKWVGEHSSSAFFPFKYKESLPTTVTKETTVMFRLAEQYLIRAEARTYLGDIVGAQADLNMIRTRAGLPNTLANNENALLNAILQERRIELFSEFGHRFFDLKRTGRINGVLASKGWKDTDVLWPIPDEEFIRNPNLLPQNPGY